MLREKLAAYAHRAWSGWMQYLFKKGTINADGSFTIDADYVARWTRQMNTEYKDLPEVEKASDKIEADAMLELIISSSVKEMMEIMNMAVKEACEHRIGE